MFWLPYVAGQYESFGLCLESFFGLFFSSLDTSGSHQLGIFGVPAFPLQSGIEQLEPEDLRQQLNKVLDLGAFVLHAYSLDENYREQPFLDEDIKG